MNRTYKKPVNGANVKGKTDDGSGKGIFKHHLRSNWSATTIYRQETKSPTADVEMKSFFFIYINKSIKQNYD